MKIILSLVATILVCSCTVPGSEEFVSYEASLEKARIAAEDVVNVYNDYDKALRRRSTSAGSFNPDLADAYVRASLTPYSAEIMEGFAAASVYTEVLARYAENDTLSLHSKDIETLRTSAGSTALLVGQPEIAAQIAALVNATTTLANASLSPQDRDDFVRSVNDGSKVVDDFLLELRTGTRDMYSRALSATALNGGSRQKLADFQIMLASWVLLIDQTRSDLAALRHAVENPSLSRPVLSGLSESAVRIDAYARQIEAARKEIEGVF